MVEKFVLEKALKTIKDDGMLTDHGMMVAEKYAQGWVNQSQRDLETERAYPELVGLFYDIRTDPELARRHATPMNAPPVAKSLADFDALEESLRKHLLDG